LQTDDGERKRGGEVDASTARDEETKPERALPIIPKNRKAGNKK